MPPMSLKAKLEAVVYAAEEPVTLAQLAVIFADEISPLLESEPQPEQIPLNGLAAEGPALTDHEDGGTESTAAPEAANSEAATSEVGTPEVAEPAATETAPVETGSNEGDAKKLARLRDRKARLEVQKLMDELIAEYAASDRGMEIREIAGGYRMATKPEYHDAVRSFIKSLKPPMKLSLQALETLAVIAYKQPVTAPEVSEIRGVDSGGVLGSLISRKLITTAGRKPVIGRPILYKTTKDFLLCFGLKDVNDLPSMEEFEKMAGELTEPETQPELELTHPEATQTEAPQAESSEAEPAPNESSELPPAEPEAASVEEAPAEVAQAEEVQIEEAQVEEIKAAEPEASPVEAPESEAAHVETETHETEPQV
jgi:segregation and condensation protein B